MLFLCSFVDQFINSMKIERCKTKINVKSNKVEGTNSRVLLQEIKSLIKIPATIYTMQVNIE